MESYNPTNNPIVIKCKAASTLPLDSLIVFQGGLKKLTKKNREKLMNSIILNGFIAPIFVWDNSGDYMLLDGTQRVTTLNYMRNQGWKIPKIPVAYIEADNERDARQKLLHITSSYGEFDEVELESWLEEFDSELKESIRLVNKEIDIKFPDADTENDDEIPEDVEPVTKMGDLWQLGNHRLLCGDSTDPDQVAVLMGDKKADMVFTDPPYGVNYDGGHFHSGNVNIKRKRKELKNDNNTEIYTKVIPIISKYCDGPCYTWFADTKPLDLFYAVHKVGEIHALIIWHKINATYAAMNAQYKQRHEPCLYWKPKGKTLKWIGKSTESTIWEIKKEGINKLHPTQKPVELAERAINNHKAKIVLDVFLGSGSTLIACEKTNRICYGMELEPHYCDVIVNRYRDWMKANKRECKIEYNWRVYSGKKKNTSKQPG